jgi:hypothetical protein
MQYVVGFIFIISRLLQSRDIILISFLGLMCKPVHLPSIFPYQSPMRPNCQSIFGGGLTWLIIALVGLRVWLRTGNALMMDMGLNAQGVAIGWWIQNGTRTISLKDLLNKAGKETYKTAWLFVMIAL